MNTCAFCESEADHAVDGVPRCKECSGKPESELDQMRTHRQIRADLLREAMTATAQAHAAAAALSAIMEDIPSRMPHPDGSQRIQNAAHALAAARNQMMEAHSRLDQFLALGVVPGDSKPDTPA